MKKIYRVLWYCDVGAKVSYGNLDQVCRLLLRKLKPDAPVVATAGGYDVLDHRTRAVVARVERQERR